MPPRREPKGTRRGQMLRGAAPPFFCLCAAFTALALLCRLFSKSLGIAGELTASAAILLLGTVAPALPLLLLAAALCGKRTLLSLFLWLLPLSALASSLPLGGGAVGELSARLLALLFGRAAPRLFFPVCLSLRLAYAYRRRLMLRLCRLWQSLFKYRRKEPIMFKFGKKKPTVVTETTRTPEPSFADESFSSLRARMEREESVGLDLADEDARTVYPEERCELDVALDAENPAFAAVAEALDDVTPAREPQRDETLGDVVSADAFFGGGVFSPSDEQEKALFAVRGGLTPEAAISRAVDAPFANPVVIPPSAPVTPRVEPTPTAPAVPTPPPTPTVKPLEPPVQIPSPAPVQPTPTPTPIPTVTVEETPIPSEPQAVPLPSSEAPASAIFAAGVLRPTAAENGVRISDATSKSAVPADAQPTPTPPPTPAAPYVYPPLSLLKPSETVSGSSDEEIRRNSESLLETLASFNVQATIRHVSRGPRITRYELIPKRGVRIRNITNLQDDISMNLATAGIRIEAPIPGLAAVGVEVPNRKSTAVRLRDMLDHERFRSAASKTTVCVGSDVTGEPVYGDIAKMPHALIAGATGMGKSVCINAILLSLLYKASPDEVKLILVDPKKVELGVYNGIPHLLVPVVVEPQKAAGALVWAVGEMERRFNMIETAGVRDIKGYNRIVRERGEKALPQIVIVIDELNDLMMSARDAVEDSICRIAQKARAAGIHLLIGTQRPSVDVITGVIKANIPSRLAFHVSSQVDSRTILDMTGAEKLLNNGDMLFFPVGVPKPIRVQGAFVEDDEVEAVTTFLKRGVGGAVIYDDEVMANIEREAEKCMPKDKRADRDGDEGLDGDDDLFSDPQFVAAVEVALKLGQISTSKIQTKLRIGFQKATNYIEAMEEMGIVGPLNGSKPREVLISADQFLEMKSRR